jgi:small ligand-binding sensory domain FIST
MTVVVVLVRLGNKARGPLVPRGPIGLNYGLERIEGYGASQTGNLVLMKCASALSTLTDTDAAIVEVVDQVAETLNGEPADLAVAFVSAHHAPGLRRLGSAVRQRGVGRHVVGCTGESIVGQGREIEAKAAVSLWSIRFPEGVRLRPIRLGFDCDHFDGWPSDLAEPTPGDDRALVVLGDPFSFPADRWLKAPGPQSSGLRVVGGMASAGQVPGSNRLVLDGQSFEDGAVGVLIDGPVSVRTVVSQGCRPVGQPMIITRADGNLIQELGRRPALEVLQETFARLDPADQDLARQGLHVGRVINEYQEFFGRGDFLVRNLIGADAAGALAVTDQVRVGQTVQFHVRDAETADEDLRGLLAQDRTGGAIAGALIFSCNGRGTRLFPAPNHDALALVDALGPIPAAGFFAMGEIGPVGGQNFLHGFTASIALFSPKA